MRFPPTNSPGRLRFIRRLFPILGLLLAGWSLGNPADSPSSLEYKVKAAYLYNFLLFVDWPQAPDLGPGVPITLCLLGRDPFENSLDPIRERTAQRRTITLKHLIDSSQIGECQLLFISRSEGKHLDEILQSVRGEPVLTVADMENFVSRGGMIGFVIRGGKVRLEINLAATSAANLKVSSKLLEVASRVVGH